MTQSVLVYTGLIFILVGVLSVLKPLSFLKIKTRRAGVLVAAIGCVLALTGALWPARSVHSTDGWLIDAFIPVYQFSEFHTVRINAPAVRVFQAIKAVTPDEIRLFRILTWIRRPRLPSKKEPETILTPPSARPILDTALRSGFFFLGERANQEIVVGTIVLAPSTSQRVTFSGQNFASLNPPGYAKAVMNFHVIDEGSGWSRVTTETRVSATDKKAERRFAVYWRLIYPGSAAIRRMWLRAIKHRAESVLVARP